MGGDRPAPSLLVDAMALASISLAVLATVACAHGAAVQGGSALTPMVWPMPKLGAQEISPLIIGGDDADKAEFPHQVSMQVSMLWILEQHICGGTILNEEWVLTAAHCVKGVPWYASAFILAGKNNLLHKEAGQQRSAVKKMFVHEKYNHNHNGGVGPYDIGLLHLKTKLVLSDSIKPARLPVQDAIPTGNATLSGWGSTSISQVVVIPEWLQKVQLPIISFADCNAWVQAESDKDGSENPLVDTNVCVGYLDHAGQGACNGDSGGPLIQTSDDGEVVVIGATSWGFFPCQSQPAPSVYTRVSAYVDWINAKIAK